MSDSLFQWDQNKFSVHVDAMDKEHQKLVDMMNKLYERSNAGASKSELGALLKEFGAYTVFHFEDEEKFFSKLPYSHAEVHKKSIGIC